MLFRSWVFASVRGLSPVAASGGHFSSRCAGLSPSRPLLLRSTSSRRAGPVVVAHGPSRSAACGIFPDQGSNPCPLHWQADSQPLHHQGSPACGIFSCSIWDLLVVTFRLLVAARRIQFPDQGSSPGPLNWERGVLTTGPPGKSLYILLDFVCILSYHLQMMFLPFQFF